MSEKDFFNWLFVVTRNQYFSRLRKFNRLRKDGLSFDDTPIEELEVAAPDDDHEGNDLFKHFLSFIEQYPEACRRVIGLWLEDNSYRQIAKKLQTTPFECSHVTARTPPPPPTHPFRASLGVEPPETATPQTGTTKKSLRVQEFKRSVAG
jgi:hypothetical protein